MPTPRMPPLWQGDGSYASARSAISRKPGLDPSTLSPRLPLIAADTSRRRKPQLPQAGTVEFYQELAGVSRTGRDRRLTGPELEALRREHNRQRLRDRKERALDLTKTAMEEEERRVREARARAIERRLERHGAATRLQAARRGQATRHHIEQRRRETAAVALQARMRGARTRTEVAANATELQAEMRARALDTIARNNAELSLYFAEVEERLERANAGEATPTLGELRQAVDALPSWDNEAFLLPEAAGAPVAAGSRSARRARDEDDADAAAHAAAAVKLQGAARGSAVRRSRLRATHGGTGGSRVPPPPPPTHDAPHEHTARRPRCRRELPEAAPDKAADPIGYACWEIRRAMAARMQRVMDIFKKLDLNGDNRVSPAEFRQALPLLELPSFYGSAEMDALVRLAHLRSTYAPPRLACVLTNVCILLHASCAIAPIAQFEAFDRDGSGALDIDELKEALRKVDGAEADLSMAPRQMVPSPQGTKRATAPRVSHDQLLPYDFTMAKPPGRGAQGRGPPGRPTAALRLNRGGSNR